MATTTSTTSTTSASSTLKTTSLVTALGGGSGIDMAALANNLATAQFEARSARLTDKSETLTTKVSTASNIKSMLLSLDTSLGTLVRSGSLARTPSVANSSVATATLSGSSQPTGSYSLEVTQVANGQRLAGSVYGSSTSTVGAGTLTLRFGTVAGSSFTEDTSQSSIDITVESGDTLADVATAINASGAGITAYVATTSSGAQLVLKGQEGTTNGFIIEAGDSSLSNLAWSPGASTGTLLATAQDATFEIDGLSYTSASNTITDAIPGVKLQLTGTNSGTPTTVSFSDPSDSIASSMQDFTDALNELMTELNTATALGGDLVNDAGARSLKRALAGLAGTTVMPNATGAAKTLADLGLSTQRDGTFTLDTSRLSATLAADPEGVAAMFTNGVYGVYASYDKIYRAAISTTNSNSLGGSITRYNKQLTQVTEDQSDLATQQEALRARLASQFTVSESRIGVLKSTLTMIENQIAQWNKSSS
ncbi:flagellar hook-associated protein 2 [Novosphingobium sp. CF614]|uniref:flagellar filament capping protein FliD n=1 Tax=Novosphingobium sp. CF614 TaxID=1884364 RepID=UPI0008ED1626|nr:flagellar filament capping protein FliD [Novosphingobium sp. CF614]SFF76251.1 flagellar hook-associated protein 2 [Novosphingobium sp. CF614]